MRSAPKVGQAKGPCACRSRLVRRSHVHHALITLLLLALSAQLRGQPAPLPNQHAGGAKRLLVIAPSAFHPALQELGPDDTTPLDFLPAVRHLDVRYAVYYGTVIGSEVRLDHVVLSRGADFFTFFQRFEGKVVNAKLQIPLPREFFS